MLWRTDSVFYRYTICAIDYEKGNTLGKKNHITKCIIKINYIACAHGPESFAKGGEIAFDTKIELLLQPIFILSAMPFSAFTLYPQKRFTGSRKLFSVVISSLEDLSDDGEL